MANDEQDDEPTRGGEEMVDINGIKVPKSMLEGMVRTFRDDPKLEQHLLALVRESVTAADVETTASVLRSTGQSAALNTYLQQHWAASYTEAAQLLSLAVSASTYRQRPDEVRELIAQDAGAQDVIATTHRQEAVKDFRRLLEDGDYFDAQAETVRGPEAVWQHFLQDNQWILGGSLSVQFLSAWDEQRLEQTVVGSSVTGEGKRNDALLRTAGRVHSLVFVEIKHHRTKLLLEDQYRPGIWAPSKELSGGVAQVQGTVQLAAAEIGKRLQERDRDGSDVPAGFSYLFRPRSYLIIGNLEQLYGENGGFHTGKFQSFELYRRHTQEPEIVTFDELLARAEGLLDNLSA